MNETDPKLDVQLKTLLGSERPDPGFKARLRRQLAPQDSSLSNLWSKSARAIFAVGAIAAMIVLIFFGVRTLDSVRQGSPVIEKTVIGGLMPTNMLSPHVNEANSEITVTPSGNPNVQDATVTETQHTPTVEVIWNPTRYPEMPNPEGLAAVSSDDYEAVFRRIADTWATVAATRQSGWYQRKSRVYDSQNFQDYGNGNVRSYKYSSETWQHFNDNNILDRQVTVIWDETEKPVDTAVMVNDWLWDSNTGFSYAPLRVDVFKPEDRDQVYGDLVRFIGGEFRLQSSVDGALMRWLNESTSVQSTRIVEGKYYKVVATDEYRYYSFQTGKLVSSRAYIIDENGQTILIRSMAVELDDQPGVPPAEILAAVADVETKIQTIEALPASSSQQAAGLTIEEYPIKYMSSIGASGFVPLWGTADEIMAKHLDLRRKEFSSQVRRVLGGDFYGNVGEKPLTVVMTSNNAINGADLRFTVTIDHGDISHTVIPVGNAGGAVAGVKGVWTFGDHWAVEVAEVYQRMAPDDPVNNNVGHIVIDGVEVGLERGYQSVYGFQLMNGSPFYFFKKDGKIGFNYAGTEVDLGYDEMLLDSCCAESNGPVKAPLMVGFFAQKEGVWYYVEIGKFD